MERSWGDNHWPNVDSALRVCHQSKRPNARGLLLVRRGHRHRLRDERFDNHRASVAPSFGQHVADHVGRSGINSRPGSSGRATVAGCRTMTQPRRNQYRTPVILAARLRVRRMTSNDLARHLEEFENASRVSGEFTYAPEFPPRKPRL